jgi:preprotein translocase subunit SecD
VNDHRLGFMKKNLRRRSIVIGVVTLFTLIVLLGPWNKDKGERASAADYFRPSHLRQNLSENIRLGLDLKGGTHLVMQVQADDAIKGVTEGNRQRAVELLTKGSLKFTEVKTPANGQVVVETADSSQHSEIRERLLTDFGSSDWSASTRTSPAAVVFDLQRLAARRIRREATEQAKTIIEQRIDAFGVAEPTIQLHGREEDHQILLQMPGVDNPERVKELIKGEARLELKAVVPGTDLFPTREAALTSLGGSLPGDREILRIHERRGASATPIEGYYIVEKTPVITGADLRDARGVPKQQGMGYNVGFNLKPQGAAKFEAWTSKNIGNLLAIVLNDEIKSAPSIKSAISDSGVIEGSFTQQESEDLGLVLRSGALPAQIVYLEERTVGPSLGAESIRQGMTALLAGLTFVISFMLFYYRLSGLNAVSALLMNLVILLAGLALFNATLTMPGIAGVILGIGMAVDSNVLIFERIREELRAGKLPKSATDAGFSKALVTIIDTHITTLLSSTLLFIFGTGAIRGFAVTVVLGLVANLFTAVYVSRTMFIWALSRAGRREEAMSI